jgi:hypothetical protein
MIALGTANMAAGSLPGLFRSAAARRARRWPKRRVRARSSPGSWARWPSRLLLILAPNPAAAACPAPLLGAVVIAACLSFADLPGMWEMYRLRKVEFVLVLTSFLGVAFVGVIEGIFITIALALLVLVWNAWHPHSAILAASTAPRATTTSAAIPKAASCPAWCIFRWDAQLFFANAELFRDRRCSRRSKRRPPRSEVGGHGIRRDHRHRHHGGRRAARCAACELLTAWHRTALCRDSRAGQGPADPVRALDTIGHDHLRVRRSAARSTAIAASHAVDWKDWDEV